MNELFETQRDMRHRRETAIRRGVMAVLDVGSHKISVWYCSFHPKSQRQGRRM